MKVCYLAMSNCPIAQFSGWEVIKKMLPGIEIVSDTNEAEVVIAYFCALTKDEIVGAKDTLVELLEEKKKRPTMKLLVGGCLPEIKHGNENYPDTFQLLNSPEIDAKFGRETMVKDILRYFGLSYEYEMTIAYVEGSAACIQIASGCNRRCSFCKCHYLHMPYRSVPIDEVRCEIERAIGEGVARLNITGENITEYGIDLNAGNVKLLGLLKEIINKYPSIKLIDLCGITLDEVDNKLLKFLTREPRIGMIQIEAQSFIPEVRRAMNLRKTADEAMRIIAELASKKPIISNIMIGHPGECEAGFMKQYEFIRQRGLFMLEPNVYVNTIGTRSFTMEQIPDLVVKRRLEEMLSLTYELRRKYVREVSARRIPARVLMKRSDGGLLLMPLNKPVMIEADEPGREVAVGDLVQCVISEPTYFNGSGKRGMTFEELMHLTDPRDNRIHLCGTIV